MEVVENLATNLPIMEVEENLATNLLAEVDPMAMEANPAIDPTPTVSQASNPATELQATIRSIPVAIGNPVIKTIYSHLKQCKLHLNLHHHHHQILIRLNQSMGTTFLIR